MGTKITSVGTRAPWNSRVLPPVTRGLEGWFELDTSIARVGFNRAIGKPNAKVIGAPEVSANWVRFKGGLNFLQTDIPDSDEMTIIALCKLSSAATNSADGAIIAGTYIGPTTTPGLEGNAAGVNLYLPHPVNAGGSASRSNGSGGVTASSVSLTATVPTTWALRAIRARTGDFTKAYDLTAGLSSVGTSNLQRAVNANKIRIGSAKGTAEFAGQSDISHVVIASAFWTDEEIAATAELMRKRAARLGIMV